MKRTFVILYGLTVLAVLARAADESKSADKLNIILFLIDDLGWRDLGCQGSTFYETPNLDQFTIDVTEEARAGKIDPILGRDAEVRQIIDVLDF